MFTSGVFFLLLLSLFLARVVLEWEEGPRIGTSKEENKEGKEGSVWTYEYMNK